PRIVIVPVLAADRLRLQPAVSVRDGQHPANDSPICGKFDPLVQLRDEYPFDGDACRDRCLTLCRQRPRLTMDEEQALPDGLPVANPGGDAVAVGVSGISVDLPDGSANLHLLAVNTNGTSTVRQQAAKSCWCLIAHQQDSRIRPPQIVL